VLEMASLMYREKERWAGEAAAAPSGSTAFDHAPPGARGERHRGIPEHALVADGNLNGRTVGAETIGHGHPAGTATPSGRSCGPRFRPQRRNLWAWPQALRPGKTGALAGRSTQPIGKETEEAISASVGTARETRDGVLTAGFSSLGPGRPTPVPAATVPWPGSLNQYVGGIRSRRSGTPGARKDG